MEEMTGPPERIGRRDPVTGKNANKLMRLEEPLLLAEIAERADVL